MANVKTTDELDGAPALATDLIRIARVGSPNVNRKLTLGAVFDLAAGEIVTLGGMELLNGDPATAPGAGKVRFAVVAGTTAGTAKLLLYAGTSTTPLEVADNIGGGF